MNVFQDVEDYLSHGGLENHIKQFQNPPKRMSAQIIRYIEDTDSRFYFNAGGAETEEEISCYIPFTQELESKLNELKYDLEENFNKLLEIKSFNPDHFKNIIGNYDFRPLLSRELLASKGLPDRYMSIIDRFFLDFYVFIEHGKRILIDQGATINTGSNKPLLSETKSFGCRLPIEALQEVYDFDIDGKYFIDRSILFEDLTSLLYSEDWTAQNIMVRLGCTTADGARLLLFLNDYFDNLDSKTIEISGKFSTKRGVLLTAANIDTSGRRDRSNPSSDLTIFINSFKTKYQKYQKIKQNCK